jgi:16S rRNA (adenine(1408)-N(1))-methyltransferase
MESIRGKTSLEISTTELAGRIASYQKIRMDIGTGDGRLVCCLAKQNQDEFFIGLDACRENLREYSQIRLPNALYVIASAQSLPQELSGLADGITINFPWGSLLESLLQADPSLLEGLLNISRPEASLHIRLNGGALAEAGWELQEGVSQVQQVLAGIGLQVEPPRLMETADLRAYPSTWARRLAFGRDPRAFYLSAKRMERRPQIQAPWPMLVSA